MLAQSLVGAAQIDSCIACEVNSPTDLMLPRQPIEREIYIYIWGGGGISGLGLWDDEQSQLIDMDLEKVSAAKTNN